MEKKKWSFVNAENVVSFVCDETYSSKQLTGDELAGFPVININEGTLKGGCRTSGGPKQEQNDVYFVRKEAWGTSMKYHDEDYLKKRMEQES